ncbi:FAD-dependent oxidoreductase [Micromonospora olivasterospora]|uniref:2-polyprenyl-6-methoxyphenol hydroxylase-like FAD-dependent oxidoreductase n=1 Tax=Micromonospora olivasterospora TaxID=1880 RepID=A0A562IHJ8_MICOL|nr:FAD-dependent oxidoreductase [Micromonospora olivasterospora]TWH70511.1 2-polyprenyl-6-methoxyphenol hydroxylase-like FAD-dependent oxidoreductase [Micromonospora olivasterospora]
MSPSPARVFAELNAARPPGAASRVMGRAVVLGGSVAGLLAARVLSDHAESVVVIDRDDVQAAGERPGVPQGTQLHALLPGGLFQLEHLFPGFRDQALAEGAVEAPPAARRNYLDGRLKVVVPDDADSLAGSRPLLEGLIRRQVLRLPNVRAVTARATGLVFDGGATVGVHVDADGVPGVESGDLVVDAMGRSSRLSEWLEHAGWDRPVTRRMTVHLNYATALFRRRESKPDPAIVLALHSPRMSSDVAGAAFFAVEDGRWMAMMAGYGDNRPGRTAGDFVRRLREQFPPEFGEVAGNEMLGDVRTYRHADSRRRDYHALRRFPAGLVSVGDAVASFNPVYGQGMTAAALHAACLSAYLRSGPDLRAPARGFFGLQKVVVDAAWSMSTSADLALPHVAGPYPRGYRLSGWVSRQIVTATITDVAVARRFNAVVSMREHPRSLATPGVLLGALRANRRAR